MIIKAKEIEINPTDPFLNCKLGRRQYAGILSIIVESLYEGGVLAINGEWGSGKTTFVRMWQALLNNNGYSTLYFNVWENDFVEDPLVAIISEFEKLNKSEKLNNRFNKVLSIAESIVSLAPTLIKEYSKEKVGAIPVALIESAASGIADSFKEAVESYKKQTKSIIDFRNTLSEYVADSSNNKPVIFIVDELDRCNPHYAVKVLERIKHLFCIPNVVFVLSIDKKQLCHSIKGYYGSHEINAEEYLRRFIDIEYQLPFPSRKDFINHLYDAFSLDEFFNSDKRKQYRHSNDKESFLVMSELLFDKETLSLRQMEKFMAHISISLRSFAPNNYINIDMLVLLLFFRMFDLDFYKNLESGSLSIQEIINHIEKVLPKSMLIKDQKYYSRSSYTVYAIAKLLLCYNENREYQDRVSLLNESKTELSFSCNIISPSLLLEDINHLLGQYENGICSLNHFTRHLNLMDGFMTNYEQ